jgi:hypothetical protein
MRIIKGTETIAVQHPVFTIFGQPGIGKSTLGYSTLRPLALDFDQGAHRAANRGDTLQITSWADVDELMATPSALEPYATVVVDTVGRCLDLITADIIAKNPKDGRGGSLSIQGWGVLKTRFRLWVTQLRAMGKDVLLVAHDKEEKDGDTRIVRPDIAGGSYGEVMKVADFVGYAYMVGKDRVLDFSPTDRWVGKNPAGWAPFKIPPVAKAGSFMAELFDTGRDALGSISDESANITAQVETWKAQIAGFTEARQFNDAIPKINTLAPILQPQVKKLLMDAATAQRFVFDRAKKGFVNPTPPPPETPSIEESEWPAESAPA